MRTTTVKLLPLNRHGQRALGWRKLRRGDRGLPLIWPVMGGNGENDGGSGQGGTGDGGAGGQQGAGGAGSGQQGAGGTGAGGGGDMPHGYPLNTPIAEMTVDQQAAYWKHHSRKHEDTVKGLGLTPGQEAAELAKMREDQAELQKLQNANLSDVERLTKENDELREKNAQLTVAQVRTQAATDAKLPADLWEFITAAEPAAAKAQAEKLAASVTPAGATSHDQGQRTPPGGQPKAGVAAGRDLYAERNARKKTTT